MKDFRLYAITGEQFHPGRDLLEVMEEAIAGGVDIIQLRDKDSSREEVLRKAKALRELTRKHGVTFIVNDYIDIALEVDADGIHLGQNDLSLQEARQLVGDKIIGISTHAIEEALLAEEQGADYIGVGPVFATKTKVDVVDPVTVAYVQEVASRIRIPFVAIGGIKLSNVDEVIAAGATRICAVSEIVGSADVAGTCRAFLSKLEGRE
ncbi:thiamine phosphate synthase [Paenibacillus radicis (ex Gao et al. 2016)]|uniref:Thiamine-phosphate synthase n=1 Tax=Paenibacillus radicis (ex Gao et al. 2016) TaxID=1737354 RepID=A0A917HH39_9BACL|nr:thiamine phosphate synthase [Paenibacillus radicis (ex Gao et al. 2016)]GGG79331.1 thiamine-phosphate synthase [Paenibacillus radicis (ex Gao et al. 2016)]